MARTPQVKVGPLKRKELEEADRIMRLAFGTFLGLTNPLDFMGNRQFMTPRWHSANVHVLAARENGRLIGTNVVTRWGAFGFFGPLTVLPEYWDRGVAQKLMEATVATFDDWRVRRSGLFTFPHSKKHVGLYQKFGYWPQYLTALMTRGTESESASESEGRISRMSLSQRIKSEQEKAIEACRQLSNGIEKGLDLSEEMRSVLAQRTGDVVLADGPEKLDGFAVCMHGPGSEGGTETCYVKFGAARGGAGAGRRFDKLLSAIEAFAASRGASLEAGVNLAQMDAFQRMRARGFRVKTQGVAMQRPHREGFNRADAWVIADWR
jgi:GNAT superfamily N-acetyltransferase